MNELTQFGKDFLQTRGREICTDELTQFSKDLIRTRGKEGLLEILKRMETECRPDSHLVPGWKMTYCLVSEWNKNGIFSLFWQVDSYGRIRLIEIPGPKSVRVWVPRCS